MGFGNRLKDLLNQKGLSIKELSEITGISINTLYSITKRDTRIPSDYILEKIANAFGIAPYELLDFTNQHNIPELDSAAYVFDSQEHQIMIEATHGMEQLNILGKKEVLKRINELLRLEEYKD